MGTVALITGITGQDGSYLTELLLAKGYQVHGIVRRTSTFNRTRIDQLVRQAHNGELPLWLHYGDMTDGTGLRRVIEQIRPDEVYNLAAQSHVRVSYDQPEYTANVVSLGTLRLLDALRDHIDKTGRFVKIYQAGSSEMFGSVPPPQNEKTPFYPRSPYAVSKVAAHWYSRNYRESYGMFICSGILFNHESPRRGEAFVTRKITRGLTRIKLGIEKKLTLGNIEAKRDWGFAGDYVEAMWLMLQQEKPDDYVIATGQSHSVREFLTVSADYLNMAWEDVVFFDPRYLRPAEVDNLEGDASYAREKLGWQPKVHFEDLVKMMIDNDLELARQEKVLLEAGYDLSNHKDKTS